MNREEIRAMVREKLKKGLLPRNVSIPSRPGQSFDAFSVRLGGSKCCVCGGDDPEVTNKFRNHRGFSFHQICERVWQEEYKTERVAKTKDQKAAKKRG